MNIILCGLPMSGKTTLGKMLAKELNWPFIDTDHCIEQAYAAETSKKYTCRQIYVQVGEANFRKLELEQIISLKKSTHTVIALGGGSLQSSVNAAMLQSIGDIVYLQTPWQIIWEKMSQSNTIPAYLNHNDPKMSFYQLTQTRVPLYLAAANLIIETSRMSMQAVLEGILIMRRIVHG